MADITGAASAASSGFPAGMAISGLLGLGQMIGGAIGAAKGRKELSSLLKQTPQYKPDEGIMGLYKQSMERLGVAPEQTAAYKRQMQNIERITSAGLRGAQDRRSGLAASSSLTRAMSDAALKARESAEQQRNQLFGQAMTAGQLAAGEQRRAFDINVMQPWETRAQMAGQRAAAGGQAFNIGAKNIFGALGGLPISFKRGSQSEEGTGSLVPGPIDTGNANQAAINRLLSARRSKY